MDELEMKQGRNQFSIGVGLGKRYNISFDVDVKKALAEKDAEIKRLWDVLIKTGMDLAELRMKYHAATGIWDLGIEYHIECVECHRQWLQFGNPSDYCPGCGSAVKLLATRGPGEYYENETS